MHCPHCASVTTKEQTQKATLGYRTFWCLTCKHRFNGRTGTPFNFLEYPTEVVLLVILWRLRYKLSLRDLAETFPGAWLGIYLGDSQGVGNAVCSAHC
jgi:transposase-like protein